jgi:hypothetical protein
MTMMMRQSLLFYIFVMVATFQVVVMSMNNIGNIGASAAAFVERTVVPASGGKTIAFTRMHNEPGEEKNCVVSSQFFCYVILGTLLAINLRSICNVVLP